MDWDALPRNEETVERMRSRSTFNSSPIATLFFFFLHGKKFYSTDSERDQRFEEPIEVFEGMKKWYSLWGYETLEVPPSTINERVSFIL